MPKTTSKTKVSRPAVKARVTRKPVTEMPVPEAPVAPVVAAMPEKKKFNPPMISAKVLRAALIVILAGLLTYKLGPWLFPAVVNNVPVSRFALWDKMEKTYGASTLDEMVNEKVLDAAIKKNGVKVDQAKVDDQMKTLEKQFESVGGLDEALKQRGLTKADLEKQVRTQLAVEEILKDKVNPSDDEVKADFDSNAKSLYKDKKFEDVKDEITSRLKDSKLRDAFLEWFAEVKKDIKVKNFGL